MIVTEKLAAELAALRAAATRPRRTVAIVCDGAAQQQIEDLDEQIDRLEAAPTSDKRITSKSQQASISALMAQRDQLAAQAAARTLHVVVEGLPSTVYRAVLAEHPPRKDDDGKILAEDSFGANEETLRAPLVRACVVDLDDETVDWLLGFVTDRQMDQLVGAALAVNRRADAVPLRRPLSPIPTSDGA